MTKQPALKEARAASWKDQPVPEVGSRWDGEIYTLTGHKVQRMGMAQRTAKVMAVADNYVMARYKNAMPFVMHLHEWFMKMTPKPLAKKSALRSETARKGQPEQP